MKNLSTYRKDERLIPVELIEQVFKHDLHKELHAYMLLNFHSKSGLYYSKNELYDVLDKHWSNRTSRKRIKALLELNWLGCQERIGRYYVRSLNTLHKSYNLESTLSTILTSDKFEHFQLFLFSSIISSAIHFLRRGKPKQRHVKPVMFSKESNRAPQAEKGFPLALSIIMSKTWYSQGHCSKLVHKAIKVGYLAMKPNLSTETLDKHHANYLKKYTDVGIRVQFKKGIYIIVGPNLYSNRLNIKRKKSLSEWKKRKT